MKQFIRTNQGCWLKKNKTQERLNGEYDTWYSGNETNILYNHNHDCIEKEADDLKELISTGDLLIVEDRTKPYPYPTFPIIYNENVPFAYDCAIYKTKEVYTKDIHGDYKLVAKEKEMGELELL